MVLIDILTGLGVLMAGLLAVGLVLWAAGALPLADWLNVRARRLGLSGPWRESRTVGVHNRGSVCGGFAMRPGEDTAAGHVHVKGELWNALCPAALAATLRDGERVEIVFNDDLTVTVVGRASSPGEVPGTPCRPEPGEHR